MKKSILISIMTSMCFLLQAQELHLEWASVAENTYHWDINNESKILRARIFEDSIAVDGQNFTSVGGHDILIERLDSNGNTIDARQIESIHDKDISDFIYNADNDMVLMAGFVDSLNIGLNQTEHWIYTEDSISRFVACYDEWFDLKWVNVIKASSHQMLHAECLLALKDGSVLVSGEYIDSLGLEGESDTIFYTNEGFSSYVVKFDVSGNTVWWNPNFHSEFVTMNRGLDVSNGNGTLNSSSLQISEIASFSLEDGSVIWNHLFSMRAHAHAVDADGNIYVTGGFDDDGQTDFDPGPDTISFDPISMDVFLLKLNQDGEFLWAKHIITGDKIDTGTDIYIDDDEVFVTGCIQRDGDFDPTDNVFELIAHGNEDAFIASYDLDGNLNWADILKGNSLDVGLHIESIEDTLLMSGVFLGSIDFDLQEGGSVFESKDGGTEVSNFFVKYLNCSEINCLTNLQEENIDNKVSIYPNPAADRMQIETDQPVTSCHIVDLKGNVIIDIGTLNEDLSTLNISMLPSGIYVLKLYQYNKMESYRFIKI
ncbi:MAG: T9SS type A sorting domain-containing protein [Bacteroidota bacterium]